MGVNDNGDLVDRLEIAEILRLERFWRDQGEWEKLAGAYAEDSFVRTTWFIGNGKDFAEASREMAEKRGRHSKHLITPTEIRVNGDRALAESLGEIHNRDFLEGVQVDTTQYCRFYSRVVRTAEGWRLMTFEGIYQKDTIVPSLPGQELVVDLEEMARLRAPYRVWAYMLSRKGYDVPQDDRIPAEDRPEALKAFYAEAEDWLYGRS